MKVARTVRGGAYAVSCKGASVSTLLFLVVIVMVLLAFGGHAALVTYTVNWSWMNASHEGFAVETLYYEFQYAFTADLAVFETLRADFTLLDDKSFISQVVVFDEAEVKYLRVRVRLSNGISYGGWSEWSDALALGAIMGKAGMAVHGVITVEFGESEER